MEQGATGIDALGDINNDGYADLLFSGFTVAYGSKDGIYKTIELKL